MSVNHTVYAWLSYLTKSLQSIYLQFFLAEITLKDQCNQSTNSDGNASTPVVSIVGTGSYYPHNTKTPECLEKIISAYYAIDPMYAYQRYITN
jgi:hypothetical protein